MKLFIDSADIDVIEHAFDSGLIDGITTNPSLIKKAMEKQNIQDMSVYINKILSIAGKKPVSLEVKGGTAEEMYEQACKLYKLFSKKSNTVVIKIPFDPTSDTEHPHHFSGLKVIEKLHRKHIPTNVTLIFTPEQALMAAKAGATYVSPFVGRIDDKIRKDHGVSFQKQDYFPSDGFQKKDGMLEDNGIISGVDLVDKIAAIFSIYDFETQIISASVRNARQVRELALVGADIATIPLPILCAMISHPKSEEGMRAFNADLVDEYNKLME